MYSEAAQWCYLQSFVGIDDESPNFKQIEKYVAEVAKEDIHFIQFSVTSKEKYYREWVDMVEGIPGHSIHKCTRSDFEWVPGTDKYVDYSYDCYLCTFPVHPEL